MARALGYDKDGWLQVQNKILEDISQNKAVYTKLQGGKKLVDKIIEGLKVESLKSKITIENWLNKLSHGHMLANVYQRPISFLSDKGSTSFFPLQIGPNSENSEPIYLLFIDGTHWVLAHVEGIDGVKPIPPPFLAPKHTSRSAKQWVDHLKKGLDLFQAKAAAEETA
jgi:hypothetical protein